MASCLPFTLHTDAPCSPQGPLALISTAVTRRCIIDNSVVGPDQAVTLDDAIRAVTIDAAHQIGRGDRLERRSKRARKRISRSWKARSLQGEPGCDRRHQGQRDVGGRGAEIRGVSGGLPVSAFMNVPGLPPLAVAPRAKLRCVCATVRHWRGSSVPGSSRNTRLG